jgi:hypothetical protein
VWKPRYSQTLPNTGVLRRVADLLLRHQPPSVSLYVDLPGHANSYDKLNDILESDSNLRPDIVLVDRSHRSCTFLELSVPADEYIVSRHTQKTEKYVNLAHNFKAMHKYNEWVFDVLAFEVSTRGFIAGSLGGALHTVSRRWKKFGWSGPKDFTAQINKLMANCSLASLRASYVIWLNRFTRDDFIHPDTLSDE